MKKILLTLALFAAIGAANAQSRHYDRGHNDRGIYSDNRGDYHWQVVERRVWIPTQRTGIFGSRVIPGHYEIRRERVKVYHRDRRHNKHPHGMPPGQRKKYQNNRYDDRRYYDNNRYDDNRNYNRVRYDKRRD